LRHSISAEASRSFISDTAQTAGLVISSTARLFSWFAVLAREGERVALLADFGTDFGVCQSWHLSYFC
jgi:hypothetical protein